MPENTIDIVLLGSDSPFEGDGTLWKAGEGEPTYRRIIHVLDGNAPDVEILRDKGLSVWAGHLVWGEKKAPPTNAKGLLAVGQEGQPSYESEFSDWMQTEHIPNLASAPGALYTTRYEAIDSSPLSFAVYYLEDYGTISTPGWTAVSRTPWRERMSTKTQNRVRGLYRIAEEN